MDAIKAKMFLSNQIATKIHQISEITDKDWTDPVVIRLVVDHFYCQSVCGPIWAKKFEAFVKETAKKIRS